MHKYKVGHLGGRKYLGEKNCALCLDKYDARMHINEPQNLKMLLIPFSLVISALWTLYIIFLLSTQVISVRTNLCQKESQQLSM
jgi:hypothetical protein